MAVVEVGFGSKFYAPSDKRLFIAFTDDNELELVRFCSEQAGLSIKIAAHKDGGKVLILDISERTAAPDSFVSSESFSKFKGLLKEAWPKLSQFIALVSADELMAISLGSLGMFGMSARMTFNQSEFEVEDEQGVVSTLSVSTLGKPIKSLQDLSPVEPPKLQ